MRFEKAHYTKAILPEHSGNPLIEALPAKSTVEEVMEKFSNYPNLDPEVRGHEDSDVRAAYLIRIETLRQPLLVYFDCYQAIERALISGYSKKNPFSPTTNQFLHYSVDERPLIEPSTGYFVPKGSGLTLIGDSGLGKTSMLEQVLNYFPHVIEHGKYKGKDVPCKYQVVWIKVDCPTKSSVRELCEDILSALDNAVNASLATKAASTIPKLLKQIEQKIKSSFLGILVIDEMQNLEFSRTGGENNLLKFLQNLVNKLGVPIFFCANPPFDESLSKTLRNARRAESTWYFQMFPLERDGEDWTDFIEELWHLQWTDVPTKLTKALNDKIYELSVGSMDMACRIYREAQRLIIGSGDEYISIPVLEDAHEISCALSSKTSEVIARKLKITKPRRKDKSKIIQGDNENKVGKQPKRVNDINRIQHFEFKEELSELQSTTNLMDDTSDPDLIRRGFDEDSLIEYFKKQDVLFDELLIDGL